MNCRENSGANHTKNSASCQLLFTLFSHRTPTFQLIRYPNVMHFVCLSRLPLNPHNLSASTAFLTKHFHKPPFFCLFQKQLLTNSSMVPHYRDTLSIWFIQAPHDSGPQLSTQTIALSILSPRLLSQFSHGKFHYFFETKEPQTLLKLRCWGVSWLEETFHHFSY